MYSMSNIYYSMILSIIPVFARSGNITGFPLLLTLPILTGDLIISLSYLHYNTVFFNPIFGGYPVLYQHLLWFLDIRKYINYSFFLYYYNFWNNENNHICGSTYDPFYGVYLCPWGCSSAHHIYTVGIEIDTRSCFTSVTMMIS